MTTLWRAVCTKCGGDFRRPTMPLVAFASCPLAACAGDLTWQQWERTTEVVAYVGRVENGVVLWVQRTTIALTPSTAYREHFATPEIGREYLRALMPSDEREIRVHRVTRTRLRRVG